MVSSDHRNIFRTTLEMMTLDEIMAALADRKLNAVADATGLSYDTVWRVAAGKTKRVSYETAKTLSDYLQGK